MARQQTESIRVSETLWLELRKIKAEVAAVIGEDNKPTDTGIIEMALSHTDRRVIIEALIETWGAPDEDARQEGLARARKKLKRVK